MRALFAVLALVACGLVEAATCTVTEFKERPPVTYQAAIVPALASNNVTYTTSSVQSPLFQDTTQLVRVACDSAAFLVFGTNPTATLSGIRLAAGQAEYFSVPIYGGLRVAVIGP